MTIAINISAYNRSTAGPLRRMVFYTDGTTPLSDDDQFRHGCRQAESIIRGLSALEPLTDFEVRSIETDSLGPGPGVTEIDGKDLFEIQREMEMLAEGEML